MLTDNAQSDLIHELARRVATGGQVTEKDLVQAQVMLEENRKNLVDWLVGLGRAEEGAFAAAATRGSGTPLLDLGTVEIDRTIVGIVNPGLLEKYRVLPLALEGNTLFVGVSDGVFRSHG